MDEFIKLLDPAYELIQYRIKEDKVIFHIASTESVTDEMKALYNTANRSLRIKFAHEKRREIKSKS